MAASRHVGPPVKILFAIAAGSGNRAGGARSCVRHMPMIAVSNDLPSADASVPAGPDWDEAFLRVESYLRAHQLESRVLLNRLATAIIAEARERARGNPAAAPVALAMGVTHERIGAWFARAGREGDQASERVRAADRLALVLADLPGRWPNCFLAGEAVPHEAAEALASATREPGPELRFSNMPPATLEFGFDAAGQPDPSNRGGRFLARAAGPWLAVILLLGVVWAASH